MFFFHKDLECGICWRGWALVWAPLWPWWSTRTWGRGPMLWWTRPGWWGGSELYLDLFISKLMSEMSVRGIGCTAPPSSLSVLWLLVFLSSSGFSGAWFSDSWDESLSLVVSSRCFDSVEIGSVRGSSSLSSLRSSRAWPSTGYNAGTIQQNRFNKVPRPKNKLSHKNVERGIFGRLEIVTVLALIIGSSLD